MSKMQQLSYKAKKNMAGAVASSAVGKKLIRENAPDEVSFLSRCR